MAWQFGIAAGVLISATYMAISLMVLRQLRLAGDGWRDNRLGHATAAIFFTCAAGHGAHLLHLIGVPVLTDGVEAVAARVNYDAHLALVDLATAVVAVTYWRLKLSEDGAVTGGIYDDPVVQQRTAAEINETVVQDLVVAGYELDRGDVDAARLTVERALAEARGLATAHAAGTPSAATGTTRGGHR